MMSFLGGLLWEGRSHVVAFFLYGFHIAELGLLFCLVVGAVLSYSFHSGPPPWRRTISS